MADGVAVDPRDDGAERAALKSEQRLIRRTRWRLVLWSGVSTLVVLVLLMKRSVAEKGEHVSAH